MLGLEGDDQPLGYSIFSLATDGYVERPDHPMSTPNPDELGPATVPRRSPPTASHPELDPRHRQRCSRTAPADA